MQEDNNLKIEMTRFGKTFDPNKKKRGDDRHREEKLPINGDEGRGDEGEGDGEGDEEVDGGHGIEEVDAHGVHAVHHAH